jgi:carbon storage regulator
MLVLTRKIGEKVVVGGNITVTVVAVEKGRVRLAFDAQHDDPLSLSPSPAASALDD